MKYAAGFTALALALACLAASAHDYSAGTIAITGPYARATVSGQPTGGGYMSFRNSGAADKLLSASAAVSTSVELHSMTMDGSMMRMRRLETIALPAASTVVLEPGGLHMMFVGLKAPLKAGESFALKLRFEKAGEVEVQVKVEAAGMAQEKH
jgi:copper(I)-binding protein